MPDHRSFPTRLNLLTAFALAVACAACVFLSGKQIRKELGVSTRGLKPTSNMNIRIPTASRYFPGLSQKVKGRNCAGNPSNLPNFQAYTPERRGKTLVRAGDEENVKGVGWTADLDEKDIRRQLNVISELLGVEPPPADTPLNEMAEALAIARSRAAIILPMETVIPTPQHPKGYPVVRVNIEGYGEAKFAIHTGSNLNIVSDELASKTKAAGKEASGLGAGGIQKRQIVTLPPLTIGGREMPEIMHTAAVAPMNPVLLELGVEGMLGTKFLENFDAEFVFPNPQVAMQGGSRIAAASSSSSLGDTSQLYSNKAGLRAGGALVLYPPGWGERGLLNTEDMAGVTCIPLLGDIPAAVLEVGHTPKITMPAVVDLGSPFSLMNEAARRALGLEVIETGVNFASKPMYALPNGKVPLSAVKDAGGYGSLRPLSQAMVGDAGIFQALQLTEFPAGLIGLDVLGKGRMILSVATQRLWAPAADTESE